MNYKEISDLIKLINKSNLSEFKMRDGDFEMTIRTTDYGKNKTQTVVAPQQQIVPIHSAIPPATFPARPMEAPAAPVSTPAPAAASEAAPTNNAAEEANNYIEVKSPIVGTFYRSASPEKPPYVKVGDTIEVGSVVCIVEAMKLFNEIESEVRGKIVKVLIEDAQPVEYDQVLFLVDPNG